ncbi:exodeoxyribonuclease V subunit alpha [Chitinophaga rhizophila]|uniref:RecBCD enzyme subunit RecD n=1 Tax=Chitinophaga rhizophila TaxID=2866212 RepID=A0ABS7GBA8_9BACT|nr:exodeoxyribonuclease V subunit alpha [Chitinophaga rhizophila]MBW8683818.1 exodeoxyribonuclease V subunit alpha [Chitinophaga rhizophila]
MHTINDVHQQFAEYFQMPALKPYAYLLSRKLSEGHICLHLDKPVDKTTDLPAFCEHLPAGSKSLRQIPLVAKDGQDSQPFVLYQERLYLQRYFRYETTFLQRIYQFLDTEKEVLADRLKMLETNRAFISNLFAAGPAFTADGGDPADWQLSAAVTGVLNNFTIITGGPGTGKTTTVAKILAILYHLDPQLKVALAAPTGKAAARMAESLRNTDLPVDDAITAQFQRLAPSTIHRLLRSKKDSPYFVYNADNPLNYDVIIIDECSMIDVALFAKLLAAVGKGTRLILLGDKDQLASVEAGSLFGDLCQAQEALNMFTAERLSLINSFIPDERRKIPATHIKAQDTHPLFQHLVELRRSHRFSGDKGIGKFSKAIINNDQAAIKGFLLPDADEQVMIDQIYSKELFANFVAGYSAFIVEKDIRKALALLNDLRVLCAIRDGEEGLYAINRNIEKILHDKRLIRVNAEFYENRPIILTRNYYEHGLFNGDTGIIRTDEQGILMAWFEDSNGDLKAILPGYLTEAETVFAMTIHKSQGSEFKEVMVILPHARDVPILTRELLYTGVTRAKQQVYVQATEDVLMQTAARFVERASGIAQRFVDDRP